MLKYKSSPLHRELLDLLSIFNSRYQVYFRTDYISVTISTVPTQWYHLVFNYIGTSSAEGVTIYHDGAEVGSSTQKKTYARNEGSGVVVIGRQFVQLLVQAYASVMVDELLFFNRKLSPAEVQILYNMH